MATLTLPGLTASGGATLDLSYALPVAITSLPAFNAFGLALLNAEVLTFSLTGTASVTALIAGLEFTVTGVPFRKDVTIAGLNGLKGAEVRDGQHHC